MQVVAQYNCIALTFTSMALDLNILQAPLTFVSSHFSSGPPIKKEFPRARIQAAEMNSIEKKKIKVCRQSWPLWDIQLHSNQS